MTLWTCPECGRRFGRVGQGHECAPAMTVDAYFATGPPHERPVYEAVAAHLATLDDVYTEPVSVGIFFKRSRTFAQLRPMTKWVALSFTLGRRLDSDRLSRKVLHEGTRFHHVVNLHGSDEVDDDVRSWLTEAYLSDPAAGTPADVLDAVLSADNHAEFVANLDDADLATR